MFEFIKNPKLLFLMSTVAALYLHKHNPELMQIIFDAGTFCGIVLLVLKEK